MVREKSVELRMREAVADWFVDHLHVPSIFFEAPWGHRRRRVDVLAIDRAGTGDVHATEVIGNLREVRQAIATVMQVPAQFRWIAVHFPSQHEADKKLDMIDRIPLFSDKGMGRVGVLQVWSSDATAKLYAEKCIPAERFAGSYYDEIDRFLRQHKPDIMFR